MTDDEILNAILAPKNGRRVVLVIDEAVVQLKKNVIANHPHYKFAFYNGIDDFIAKCD